MVSQQDYIPGYGDYLVLTDDCDSSVEKAVLELEQYAEPVERYYQPGLYYPVRVGELLVGRYRIEHKLGHGGFSTVWMAHDVEEQRDVALKIMVTGAVGEHELDMQNKIIQTVQDHSNLLLYTSTFLLESSAGYYHRVLVFPLRGPSLGSFIKKYLKGMSMVARMSAAKQLLQALNSLHTRGIVHRDLNSNCVMWGLVSLDNLNIDAKYKLLGRPQKMELDELWREGDHVGPMEPSLSLLTDTIYLGDFGHSIEVGTLVNQKVQTPIFYCAPERLHDINPSPASDMWSYMCIFFELCTGLIPFSTPFFCQDIALLMDDFVNVCGPLPEKWKGHYTVGDRVDDSWYDQRRAPEPTMSISSLIERGRPGISSYERDLILSVLLKGLCYLPEDRITTTQLLQDSSFRALMEMYGC